ncbi:hypothetical protein [Maricaulis sp.]|uniref:hypothetical protein n=1 Tax=Maricaulis sp. TaxID=1486257 RepID=UPI002622A4ED|nr:hypothetical protein [Maricaulis sp.]
MKLVASALLSATALALFAPSAMAQSQSYAECVNEREDRQVAGAIVGGLLGAIVGNELADDNNDRDYRHHRRGHRYDRHRRGRHHYHRRHRHRDNDNDEAVATIAGAGFGAVLGAGLASGEDCEHLRDQRRYDDRRYDDRRYQDQRHDSRYDNRDYRDQRYDDRYEYEYDRGSNVELMGGRDNNQARTYQASSNDYWTCEYRNSPQYNQYGEVSYREIYMCEGSDGIWRPYEAYVNE